MPQPPALDQTPNHFKDRPTRWLAHKLENYRNGNRKLPTGKKKDLSYTLGAPAVKIFLLVITHILVLRKRGITLSLSKRDSERLPGQQGRKIARFDRLRLRRELSRADAILLALAPVGNHQLPYQRATQRRPSPVATLCSEAMLLPPW